APGEIVRVDPATGARATFASGGAIQHPDAIIAAPGGGFFVADRGSQEIIRLDASGNQTVFATSASFVVPQGMAFDASGNLYVADQGAAALFRITPGGALSVVSSGQLFGHPIDVAIGASGDLFVADQSAGGGIYRVDAATGAQSRLTSGLTHAIAFAADGRLIATDGQTAVYFVDPATGATEPIAAIDAAAFEVVPGAVPEPAGLALAALGALALRRARRRG
ncbi:MAG TPA: hypothetical protein VHF22_00110, partial [Planctomycetota bacterium]|nr:hypothetical protein [Planctomycetota bacterium]